MAGFHIDQPVSPLVAPALTELGHQSVHSKTLGMTRADDDEHLCVATKNLRSVITQNGDDFKMLHGLLMRWNHGWGASNVHHGILIIPVNLPKREIAMVVHRFVKTGGVLLSNQLYEWKGTWERYEVPRMT